MDYIQIINELKMSSDSQARKIAASYDIELSTSDIRALRPLLDDISFHWIFTGIPESFMKKVQNAIGYKKTEMLFRMYLDATK